MKTLPNPLIVKPNMTFTGIGDEAANGLDGQIHSIQELGWSSLEMRGVEVPGFTKANFHDIPEPAFRSGSTQVGSRRPVSLLFWFNHL